MCGIGISALVLAVQLLLLLLLLVVLLLPPLPSLHVVVHAANAVSYTNSNADNECKLFALNSIKCLHVPLVLCSNITSTNDMLVCQLGEHNM